MNPFWWRALGLAWLLLLALGLWQLRLDVQVLNLLPRDLPTVKALKLYEEHFANANELVISLQGVPPDSLEEAARNLAGELRTRTNLVAQAVWMPPWLEHPEQMAEFSAYLWLNQPPGEIEKLTARLSATNLSVLLEEAKQQLAISLSPDEIARLSYDPFGLLQVPGHESGSPSIGNGHALFASDEGDFRILFVHPAEPLRSYRENQIWLQKLEEIIAIWKESAGYRDLKLRFTGRPAFVSEISGSMEWDITTSVGGTLLIIAALFWWVHRRWKPLLWLITLLLVILLTTLAIGGLIFHSLNVISIGFAAILLGLSVDYGLVLYQEWLGSGTASKEQVRRAVAPSIIWAASTTAGAFIFLNLGGLPGLAQLGTMVALGVAISSGVMLAFYIVPFKTKVQAVEHHYRNGDRRGGSSILFSIITLLIIVGGVAILVFAPPRMDVSSEPLRPAHSPAYQAVEEIKLRMDRPDEPLWVVGMGTSFDDLAARFEQAALFLEKARLQGRIARASTPEELIPRPEWQKQTSPVLAHLARRQAEFVQAALQAGFTENAVGLLKTMFEKWREAATASLPVLPQAEAGHWIMQRFLSLDPGTFFALGMVHPSEKTDQPEVREELSANLAESGVILTGWELLGSEVFSVVKKNLWLIFGLMSVLVLLCLSFAFRRVLPVILSLCSVVVSAFLLLMVMWLAGWDWNLMNLMAIPLLVGAGLDYSIHVQLALDRHGGSVREMRATVGRALSLCAATTFTGFGSLAWAGNPGLGTLGKVCAAGIASAYIVAVWLLPAWRSSLQHPRELPLEK